jgi:hypothetical protein
LAPKVKLDPRAIPVIPARLVLKDRLVKLARKVKLALKELKANREKPGPE